MLSKGKKQPAYESLCCVADRLGFRIGIGIGEPVPFAFNAVGEPVGWRNPLVHLVAYEGPNAKAGAEIAQPDTDMSFIKACARLSGILRLHNAA